MNLEGEVRSPSISQGPQREPAVCRYDQTGRGRILFVDDEQQIVRVARIILKRLGYEVTALNSSPEALDCFRSQPHAFDLILTDLTMPDIAGLELAEEFKRIRPDIPILLTTGYSHTVPDEHLKRAGIRELLIKPFNISDLAGALRRALN